MTIIFAALTAWLVVKVRTNKGGEKVLLRMDEKGLTDCNPTLPKGFISWQKITSASVYMGRQHELTLDEAGTLGDKKVYIALDLSPIPADVVAQKANEYIMRYGSRT